MRRLVILCLAPLAACGSDSKPKPDAAKDIGFNKPTASLHANMPSSTSGAVPVDLGPADLTCLGTASADQPTSTAVTLATIVKDFQNHTPVPTATVKVFPTVDYMNVFDTQTSDSNGNVTVHIPSGTKRFGFEMTTTDGSVMPTFLLFQYVDPSMATQTLDKIQTVSTSTATLLPALIGETRMPGTGVLAGALRDCAGHEISNFIATVSSTPGTATPITGSEAYYFQAGVDLPVHHCMAGMCNQNELDSSSGDGLFMVVQLPVAPTAYVQMWGYKTDADVASGTLTEIAELQVPVLADTVITGSYEPLRQ
ncbi:MAG: hypothetical protein ACM31C_04370 [Acidobacteriota bacterium]